MTAVAAFAAGLACWLLLGPARPLRLLVRAAPAARWRGRGARAGLAGAGVAGALLVGGLLGGGAGAALGTSAALPVLTAVLVWRRHRGRAAAVVAGEEVFGACQLLAGLLRVGHVPTAALQIAARDAPLLAEAAAVLEVGGPVAPALRRCGARPGCESLVELGIAWEVAERTGASLTATLDALTGRLSARRAVDHVVAAELSAPRATGRLLAVLPVAGVLLGYSFGGDPLAFLAGSLPGQLSLTAGVALGCAGVVWTERIADVGGS